eukprot:SAG25_NODE_106_length_15358_cov_22.913559_6_plen_753_part_00
MLEIAVFCTFLLVFAQYTDFCTPADQQERQMIHMRSRPGRRGAVTAEDGDLQRAVAGWQNQQPPPPPACVPKESGDDHGNAPVRAKHPVAAASGALVQLRDKTEQTSSSSRPRPTPPDTPLAKFVLEHYLQVQSQLARNTLSTAQLTQYAWSELLYAFCTTRNLESKSLQQWRQERWSDLQVPQADTSERLAEWAKSADAPADAPPWFVHVSRVIRPPNPPPTPVGPPPVGDHISRRVLPSIGQLSALEGLTMADSVTTNALVDQLQRAAEPAKASSVRLQNENEKISGTASIKTEQASFYNMVKMEGLMTASEVTARRTITVQAGTRDTGFSSMVQHLGQATADKLLAQQREVALRESYLDRLWQESVGQILEEDVVEELRPVEQCGVCSTGLWRFGAGHPAFARIGLPPKGAVWPCAVCGKEFGAESALFVCSTPEHCVWRVCQVCRNGTSTSMVRYEDQEKSENPALWTRLEAAHQQAAVAEAAVTTAVTKIGVAPPQVPPRVTSRSRRKQRQLELNRRLGFVDDNGWEDAPPPIVRANRNKRNRPMPAGSKRNHGHYDYSLDTTGLSKFTKPRLQAVARLQARWRGIWARRHGAVEMERSRRQEAERLRHLRSRFRIVVARVLLLLMATSDWKDKSARAVRKRERVAKRMGKRMQRKKKVIRPLPHCFLWLCYLVCLVWILFCGLFTLSVAITFGPNISTSWLGTSIGSAMFEALVQDPIKIVVVVFLAEKAEFFVDCYYEMLDMLPI